jgi:predicted  nucleic acid-binding Zn-ribbon protein
MRQVEQLFRLQELDDRLVAEATWLRSCVERRAALQAALAAAKQAVEAQRIAVRDAELSLRKSERALEEVERQLQEAEGRLYSAAVHSPREAAALEAQIEQLRARKGQLEDDALKWMLSLDEMRERLKRLEQEAAVIIPNHEATLAALQAEERAHEGERQRLLAERSAQTATIAPAALQLYEQLRASRGRAVARIEGTTCSNCRLEVALLTRKAAQGENLVRCENCGCILYGSP